MRPPVLSSPIPTRLPPWLLRAWGPVGYVDRDNVYFRCGALELDTGLNFPMLKKLTAKVPVVKAMCGDDGALLEMVLEKEPDAIIVEGFGRGNLPGRNDACD